MWHIGNHHLFSLYFIFAARVVLGSNRTVFLNVFVAAMRPPSCGRKPSPRGIRDEFISAGLTTLLQSNTVLGCYTQAQGQGRGENQLC